MIGEILFFIVGLLPAIIPTYQYELELLDELDDELDVELDDELVVVVVDVVVDAVLPTEE